MLKIERMDKKPEARAEEIRQNWRVWANRSGYAKITSVPVVQDTMSVSLEVFASNIQEDTYLLYIPSIPRTVGGETLYIIHNQEQLDFMLDAAKKMVAIAMLMAQEKRKMQNYKLN